MSRTELEVLRAQCPKPPAAHLPRRAAGSVETIEAAVLTRMGQAGLAERAMGTAAMEQAGRLGAT